MAQFLDSVLQVGPNSLILKFHFVPLDLQLMDLGLEFEYFIFAFETVVPLHVLHLI